MKKKNVSECGSCINYLPRSLAYANKKIKEKDWGLCSIGKIVKSGNPIWGESFIKFSCKEKNRNKDCMDYKYWCSAKLDEFKNSFFIRIDQNKSIGYKIIRLILNHQRGSCLDDPLEKNPRK